MPADCCITYIICNRTIQQLAREAKCIYSMQNAMVRMIIPAITEYNRILRSIAHLHTFPHACHAVGSLSSRAQQEDLNRQEVELMSRVRELRQRLVKSTGASLTLDSDLSGSPLLQSATI